jgi:hypothetical protein
LADKEKGLYPFIRPEFLHPTVFQADKKSQLGKDWRIE